MIKVLSKGIHTSIQDLGRIGYQDMGVPIAGVMDSYAAKFANTVLGNKENDAVIEITLGLTKLEFISNCVICIAGGDFSAKINNQSVVLNSILNIEAGSILSFGKRNFGARVYIAVLGGCLTEEVLQSRSFSKGITKQTQLYKQDIIPVATDQKMKNNTYAKVKFKEEYMQTDKLFAFKGAEYEFLSENQKSKLVQTNFLITTENSRMGYILNETIENTLPSIYSSGVLPGTVQLTPSGKLIVLMRDCQVTGGYPRVLQLTEMAINSLAQKTTSDLINFKVVDFIYK